MKYLVSAMPMLLGVEIISVICLIILAICVLDDIIKADERRSAR